MIALSPGQVTSLRHLPSWGLLAFGAGAVNAGAFFACQRFVAHITGTVTRVGTDAGHMLGLDYLLVLALFVIGALSAVIIVRKMPSSNTPAFWIPLTLVSMIVAGVGITGHFGAFGTFGGSVETTHDFVFLSILSFAMGMQSASVAVSTGMAVRTTHMTGPATDLAVAGATWLTTREEKERGAAVQSMKLRTTKLVSFVVGALVMAQVAPRFGFLAFILPATACAIATLSSYVPWSARQVQSAVTEALVRVRNEGRRQRPVGV